MIEKIRNDIISLKGKRIKFKYNGSRNQIEEFEGIILSCYKYIFIIRVDNLNKSFSYSDILIGNLEYNI